MGFFSDHEANGKADTGHTRYSMLYLAALYCSKAYADVLQYTAARRMLTYADVC